LFTATVSICGNGMLEAAEQCEQTAGVFAPCCNSATCMLLPATIVCRPAGSQCDAAEMCNGVTTSCPADLPAPSDTLCNDGLSCTFNDTCVGSTCVGLNNLCQCSSAIDCVMSGTSPCVVTSCVAGVCASANVAAGTACDDTVGCTENDVCNGAGLCVGTPANCSLFDSVCGVGICTSNGACASIPANAGRVCRTSSGSCDFVETCDGIQTNCPADSGVDTVCVTCDLRYQYFDASLRQCVINGA
jgi:hypothetical protein